jgi:hypothetical protein
MFHDSDANVSNGCGCLTKEDKMAEKAKSKKKPEKQTAKDKPAPKKAKGKVTGRR